MVANELYSSNAMFINGMIASKCGQTGFHLEIFVWGGKESKPSCTCKSNKYCTTVIGLAAFMRGRGLSTLVVILFVCHNGKSLSGHQT